MRRLLRWAFNLAAAASAALFVAGVALWVRSYRVCDTKDGYLGGEFYSFCSRNGEALVAWAYFGDQPPLNDTWGHLPLSEWPGLDTPLTAGMSWHFAGFGRGDGGILNGRAVVFPLWPPALAALVLPAARWREALVRRRRPRKGVCAACGYDLTGNVSGTCPECGGAVNAGGRVTA